MKKKVYFVQVHISYSSPCFLPYASGCIAAYLNNDPEITQVYDIPDIIMMREKTDVVINRFRDPYFVAFSCNQWTMEYNKALAKKLKERFPEVKILFGGHSVPHDTSFLEEFPFVDFLMHGEGEEATDKLLRALADGSPLDDVPNLSFRTENGYHTTKDYMPADISAFPSPYLTGIFDGIMAEFPDIEFHATVETNRGCLYSCAYCAWCFSKKIRPFPIEKVKAEIEWVAKHKIPYCYCADSNFGILDRDVEIAKYVVEVRKKYGYPEIFKPNYAKESDDNVFEAGCILNGNNADKGITLSYQSVDKTTLENIGRKNLTIEHYSDLVRRYAEAGIPTYSELILGMPGETYESFTAGLCGLLEAGQSNSMLVYECQVYPNTPMGDPEYQKKHGIKTVRIPMLQAHYNPDFNGSQEYYNIIYETNTMTKDEWVKSYMFCVITQAFHHFGLLKYFAIYLRREKNISYFEFYSRLIDYIFNENKGFLHELYQGLYDTKANLSGENWTYRKELFSDTGWYFEEGAYLETVYRADLFPDEIRPFLESFDIDKELFEELFRYQMAMIRRIDTGDIEVRSAYNFYPYFEDKENAMKLKKADSVLKVHTDYSFSDWADFARKVIWFGKRHGVSLMANYRDRTEYTENTAE